MTDAPNVYDKFRGMNLKSNETITNVTTGTEGEYRLTIEVDNGTDKPNYYTAVYDPSNLDKPEFYETYSSNPDDVTAPHTTTGHYKKPNFDEPGDGTKSNLPGEVEKTKGPLSDVEDSKASDEEPGGLPKIAGPINVTPNPPETYEELIAKRQADAAAGKPMSDVLDPWLIRDDGTYINGSDPAEVKDAYEKWAAKNQPTKIDDTGTGTKGGLPDVTPGDGKVPGTGTGEPNVTPEVPVEPDVTPGNEPKESPVTPPTGGGGSGSGGSGSGGGGKTTPSSGIPAAAASAGTAMNWLDSSPDMLKNFIVKNDSDPRTSGRSSDPLGEYSKLDPALAEIMRKNMHGVPQIKIGGLGSIAGDNVNEEMIGGYADGGVAFCCKYAPKFATCTTDSLIPTMTTTRRSPLALVQLKHLQPTIHSQGNMGGMARGGLPTKYAEAAPRGHDPEFITGMTGYYACGGGTGQSDDIPAMLHDGDYVMDAEAVSALGDGSSKAGRDILEGFRNQVSYKDTTEGKPVPAKIADGEYVFPAGFVTAIGGGSNKKGAEILNGLREQLRLHKRSAPTSKIPPKAKSPLDYIKKAKG